MFSKKWLILLAAFLVAIFLLFACEPAPEPDEPEPDDEVVPEEPPEEITIGYTTSKGGVYAPQAHGDHNARLVWADWVNEEGGIYVPEYDTRIPVELIYYDDESDAETMLRLYERLIEIDEVDLVMPPSTTGLHLALASIAERYGVPIVGSSAASMTLLELEIENFWFTTACMPYRQMEAFADMLNEYSDYIETIAVAYVAEPYPRENLDFLLPLLEEGGFEVVLVEDYPVGPDDLSSLIFDLIDEEPDAFIGLTYAPDAMLITRQSIEYGFDPKLMAFLPGPATLAYEETFGHEAIEGVVFMTEWSPKEPWPGSAEFNERYIDMHGERPDYLNSPLAIMSAHVLQQAVEEVGLDWDDLTDYINEAEFESITGPIEFERSDNVAAVAVWGQWQDGVAEIVWSPERATGELIIPKPEWP